MAFAENFTVTQDSPETLTLTDASTGDDPTLVDKTISVNIYNNSLLGGTTFTWNLADSAYTLTDLLDKDYALSITVVANTPTPDPDAVYTKTVLVITKEFNELFMDGLITEKEVRYPNIVNDANFRFNKQLFRELIDDATIAVTRMNDIFKSQFCLDQATKMRINQNNFF